MDEKFNDENGVFFEYQAWLGKQNIVTAEIVSNFPSFVGHVNLVRFLSLYEVYHSTLQLSGSIADLGTWKGASFFTFGKLVKIFEPYSNTEVHGFDWFRGQVPGEPDDPRNEGKYISSKDDLLQMIKMQGLEGLMKLHDLDLVTEIEHFFSSHPALRFKVAFIDCGIESVLKSSLPVIWSRMVPGGVLILDHFNHEISPTESLILLETIGNVKIEQASFSRSPTGFITKPSDSRSREC